MYQGKCHHAAANSVTKNQTETITTVIMQITYVQLKVQIKVKKQSCKLTNLLINS